MPKNKMRTTLQTKPDPDKPKNSVFHSDVNHFHGKVCQNYVAEHGGKKRIFADFILNSPFSMEFDFEIDWNNQSLEYNGDQSLLHLNYWILGHSPTSANILVTSNPRFSYSASMSKKHCLKKIPSEMEVAPRSNC